jgi:glycerol-3-phosphate dehydrogenase
MHASGHSHGIVYTGADCAKGSAAARLCRDGNRMFDALCKELQVPFTRAGQYVYARGNRLAATLLALRARRNKINARVVAGDKARKSTPKVSPDFPFALHFPDTGIVSPHGLTIALMENAVDNGVRLMLSTLVTGMDMQKDTIVAVHTTQGTVRPRLVINAAGCYADAVAAMAQDQFFSLRPRKSTALVLGGDALTDCVVGTLEEGKPVYGGPCTAAAAEGGVLCTSPPIETPSRENEGVEAPGLAAILREQAKVFPSIDRGDVITYFAGVCAATYEEDFVVAGGRNTVNIVHVAGIQVPGIAAAPAIAREAADIALRKLGQVKPYADFNPERVVTPPLNALSIPERAAAIAADPAYGEIICGCMNVSRGEITDALHRPFIVPTLDGVKRRVRTGYGRCQGSGCNPKVAAVIAETFGVPVENIPKRNPGSEVVIGDLRARPQQREDNRNEG